MGEIVGVIVVTIIAIKIMAELVPVLIELTGLIIRFLALCAFVALRFALKALWRGLRTGLPLAWQAGREATLFIIIFWDEWRHADADGDAADGDGDGEDDDDGDDAHQHADGRARRLAGALRLLGLKPDCSREELKAAYKRAILKAHPDAGGSAAQAAAVNVARDLIAQEMDWA